MKLPLPKTRRWLPVLLLAIAAAAALAWWALRPGPATPPRQALPVAAVAPPPREVSLYFAAPDGTRLEAETRELDNCPDETRCQLATVQALIDGPATGLVPVLPPQTQLHGVTVGDDGLARIDFNPELVSGHPGGSMTELLTVYALADTLAANFPYIRQVRLLVDGRPLETLKGHVDLRRPVTADFNYTRDPGRPEQAATGMQEKSP